MDIQMLANTLLEEGVTKRTQDLYILPKKDSYEIFYRLGDEIFEKQSISKETAEKLILHFKFRSGMNIGEKRRAQLGSFLFENGDKKSRLRLSSVGDYEQNESLVIRFLHDKENKKLSYFFPEQLEQISKMTEKSGLILFCGATGNGKTTTMYEVATRFKNSQIIAIEDPVEIAEEEILQLQVNQEIGMDYDSLIKLCLRHRPDILIVGEIRDELTAKSVVRASLTGHTVLSTLHARNLFGVRERLFDLGVPEEELQQCLQGIVYQKILPATDGTLKVLYDIWKYDRGGVKSEWNERLQELEAKGILSKKVVERERMDE